MVSPVHGDGKRAAPRVPVQKSLSTLPPFTRVSRQADKHLMLTGQSVTPIGTKRRVLGTTWIRRTCFPGPRHQKSLGSVFCT